MSKTVRIMISVTQRDADALDAFAKQLRVSRSSCAAMLIGQALDKRRTEFVPDYDMTKEEVDDQEPALDRADP